MDRQEMGAFLKACRSRIDPRTAGFPVSRRRRVAGLRREEIAELADISADWYTRLEQGRDVGVSREVLQRLITALRLTASEAEHLIALSGISPRPAAPASPRKNAAGDGTYQHLLDALSPHPAYYITGPWDLMAWNDAAARIVPEILAPETHGNLLRMIFCHDRFRARLVDWESHARQCLAVFRGDYGQHPGDTRFRRLAAELTVASTEFAQWWPAHEVGIRSPTAKRLQDPELGELNFVAQFFHAAEQPDLVLVVFTGDTTTQQRIAGALL
ncbi:helix-turn-helix transcriptional regulator [Arhodomonas sp. AD133]|uniref:helix-turn-helix transcriptional regulator n=1 Tax=Arhodomonas sp. AD133 TaxID=3415009 RepID=UPI003EB7CFA7